MSNAKLYCVQLLRPPALSASHACKLDHGHRGVMKTALIFGISGQDGSLLAAHLLRLGYAIHGTSRDKELSGFAKLKRLGIYDDVILHSVDPTDFGSVFSVISETAPDEIYNLASQSSVGLSFEQPIQTLESTIFGAHNIVD